MSDKENVWISLSKPIYKTKGTILRSKARWYNEGVEQTLADIDVPIRLINSDYRPSNTRAGQALTDSFEATLMSGVGHFVMQEDPAQFNAIMTELLNR